MEADYDNTETTDVPTKPPEKEFKVHDDEDVLNDKEEDDEENEDDPIGQIFAAGPIPRKPLPMNPFDVAELDLTTSRGSCLHALANKPLDTKYFGSGGLGMRTTDAFVNFKSDTTAHMSECCMLDIMEVVSETPTGCVLNNLIYHPQIPLAHVIATAKRRRNAPPSAKKDCMELNLKMAYSYLRKSISGPTTTSWMQPQ
jgi:hypothetical protein